MSDLRKNLSAIQMKLKAPKSQENTFGNYSYRSCADIVEAVKHHLDGAILTLSDDMVAVGDRVYVKATATYTIGDNSISTTAFAREAITKKGMDDSQITGAASSYARKYALNGLFAIDDTKDADTDDYQKETQDALLKSKNALMQAVTYDDEITCKEVWQELSKSEKETIWKQLDKTIQESVRTLLLEAA